MTGLHPTGGDTMFVGEPRITQENDEICVSADVRIDTPGLAMPKRLWFRFPTDYREYINEGSDGFAAAMLPVAMLLGEDLRVEGRVSPRLAYGMRELQTAYHQWWPELFSLARFEFAEVARENRPRAGNAVGCTCSGGIDSFYSIWKHMPRNETVPELRLTHCLIVNGFNFDVDPDRTKGFPRVYQTYEPVLRRNGVSLLIARHNGQAFLEATGKVKQTSPTLSVGIISSLLMLGNLYRYFYLPGGATYRYEENLPHGFHPSTLRLLSSDDTEIIFDGGDAARTEKTATIAAWEDTYPVLRVCWRPTVFNEKTGLVENCCRCPKCLRTMLTLEAAGALSKYRTFPLPLDRALVRTSQQVSVDEKLFYFGLVEFARKQGRADIVRDLRYARFRSRLIAAVQHRVLRRRRPAH